MARRDGVLRYTVTAPNRSASPLNRTAPRRGSAWLDRIGLSASVACILHCLALTLAVVLWPAIWFRQRIGGVDLGWLLAIEVALALLSIAMGVGAAVAGWRAHRRPGPPLLLLAGLAVLGTGVFTRLHLVPVWGTAVVVAGGILLVTGHVWNLRAGHRHEH